MSCDHKPIVIAFNIHRLSEVKDGPIVVFLFEGNGQCHECKTEFRVYRIKMEPQPKPGALAEANPCEHRNFEAKSAVDHLKHGFDRFLAVSVNIKCYDCGMPFKPFQFRLEPIDKETDLIIPTDEELERIGKEAVH